MGSAANVVFTITSDNNALISYTMSSVAELLRTSNYRAVRGQRRVRVLMKRGGQVILDHLKKLIEDSQLTDEQHIHPEEEGKTTY